MMEEGVIRRFGEICNLLVVVGAAAEEPVAGWGQGALG